MPEHAAAPGWPGPPQAHRAWIGLGANLGPRQATLEQAIQALHHLPRSRLVARSRVWSSAPVDAHGPDFLNAVVALDCCLDPLDLLDHLQTIEHHHGRLRPYPNAPRTLDLDLLLFGPVRCNTPRLTLPHPRMHVRAFVLAPLLELSPDLCIPGRGPARALLDALDRQDCRPWREDSDRDSLSSLNGLP